MPGNIKKVAKKWWRLLAALPADLLSMLQLWLNPWFRLKIDHFSQKSNKNELKSENFPYLWHFWKKNNNETQCCGVKWTWGAAGGWQWSRCLEHCMNYLGSLTPSPLPSQHPHKAIVLFANQTYWRTWGTKTYWGTCRLATFFPSTRAPPVVWCCAMEPRHNKETVDPFRRQSINLFCQQ